MLVYISNCLNNVQVYLEQTQTGTPSPKTLIYSVYTWRCRGEKNAVSKLSERQQNLHNQISQYRCIETKHQISKVRICIHRAPVGGHKQTDQLYDILFLFSHLILDTKINAAYPCVRSKQPRCGGDMKLCSVGNKT